MKNTTKKILSMLLAVIMLLSVMPFSFSAEAKLSYEAQEHIDAFAKMLSYERNLYDFGGWLGHLDLPVQNPFGDIRIRYPDYVITSNYLEDSANAEAVSEGTKMYKAAIKETEDYLKKIKIPVVIDTYEFYKYSVKLKAFYDNNDFVSFVENNKNAEKIYEAISFIDEADALYTYENIKTQVEFDACWKRACPVLDLVFNCFDGNHLYGEYISNNDATEEADGTKTATCEFCGATDTVIDEGSKIDNNDNGKCSCNCHKSGIMGIIWKILNFFYRIFGMNKTCSCGVAHY